MATYEYELTSPPKDERARELWIQHAAGFILFEDSRAYAIEKIDPRLGSQARAAVVKGIDAALYGLMMIIDGESGRLSNARGEIHLAMIVRHHRRRAAGDTAVVQELDLADGDGMCMGIHGWREGDFGKHPPAVRRPAKSRAKARTRAGSRVGSKAKRGVKPTTQRKRRRRE